MGDLEPLSPVLQSKLFTALHCNVCCCMQDFEKGEVKQFKKAWLWYEKLAERMAGSGHCLDVFACSLDQVGIAEMHEAIAKTGQQAA